MGCGGARVWLDCKLPAWMFIPAMILSNLHVALSLEAEGVEDILDEILLEAEELLIGLISSLAGHAPHYALEGLHQVHDRHYPPCSHGGEASGEGHI